MKKLLYLFLAFGVSLVSFGQTTLIPDPNFEQALIDLGYDTPPIDGSVLTANINGVTDLNVNSKNISDLTGIQDFVALNELFCRFNNLVSLDMSGNTALTYLRCDTNQLTNLNVSNNPELFNLICFNNKLTSLEVSGNIALGGLTCYNNQLTTLDVSNNTALITLDCPNNQLTNLILGNNNALTSIICHSNQLTSLNVSNCTALSGLSCYNNFIEVLDVSNNNALNVLNCNINQIESLDLSNNQVLTSLDCNSNELTILDVRNGTNINLVNFNAINNSNLTCIYVDNAEYSSQNWTSIDPNSTFVENEAECAALAVGDNSLDTELIVYPSPTDNYLFIQGATSQLSATVYNMLGKQVLFTNNTDKIDVSGLSDGVYIIQISDGVNETQRKFIKN